MTKQEEIDELWKIEVERRIDEVDPGKVKLIPVEQVFERLRQKYKAKDFKSKTKLKKIDTKH